MFNSDNVPVNHDPAMFHRANEQAAPIVGRIILDFAALETDITNMTHIARTKASPEKREADRKLPHKVMERINAWIHEVLANSPYASKGDAFRETFRRLKLLRDNLAHNVRAAWFDRSDQLRIYVLYENKDYERQLKQWEQKPPKGSDPPSPVIGEVLSLLDLQVAYNDLIDTTDFVSEVHKSARFPKP